MDAITDGAVHTVVVMKPSQIGWTEIIGNVVGYFIDRDPASMLIMQPTVKMAETWSKKRLTPMLRDTPCLRGKIRDAKSRDSDNTILEKGFPGGYMAIVGANTPSDLASRPIRIVLADEVDKYPASAGEAGDPLSLASSRQATFWNRKTLIGSTPLLKQTSVVYREYLGGDRREYRVPCPDCDHRQTLRWEQIVWDKDDEGHRPETAAYVCEECGSLWSDAQRWRAISRGEWVATAPFRGVASFAVTGMMSPWLTLEDMVRKFLEAKDWPMRLRQWVNEVKGEPFEERGEAADAGALANRLEAYDGDSLPEAVRLVTAGVDTQDDRLEVTFVGWADGEEAWTVRHDLLLGDTAKLPVWDELDRALRDSVFTTEDGRRLKVRAACIDSGGHRGAMVLSFARARANRRIYATKGIGNDHRGSKPIWSKTMLGTKNAGDRLWGVGVDTGKDDLAARLRIVPGDEPTPKAVHFPVTGLPVGYFEQLTAEHAVTEIDARTGRKKRIWKMKPGVERNEALDCWILAEAAMLSLPTRLVRTPVRTGVPVAEEDEAAAEVQEPALEPVRAPVRRRRRWEAYA